jgi:hypothetical protein
MDAAGGMPSRRTGAEVGLDDASQDGNSSASRILTRPGEGCEIPRDTRYRDAFANPGNHVVQVQVVENRGTTVTGPLQSGPPWSGRPV